MRGGADAFLLREKALEGRALLELATAARTITRAHGAKLLVSDRFDVALAAEADGVHLPETGFDPRDVRAQSGKRLLIGRSVHDAGGARKAGAAGADYLMLGPVFSTPGKNPLGPGAAGEIARACSIPVTAVGGIDATRVEELGALGFRSFAVIRAIAGNVTATDTENAENAENSRDAARALATAIARATGRGEMP